MTLTADDCVFFWKPNEPHGWASQWYPSPFAASISIDDEDQTVTFPSAEHWMMVQKALLFADSDMAKEILEVTAVTPGAMATVKALGRKVSNFDDDLWKANRERIVLEGSLHKFRQNAELKASLLATEDKVLIEASPRDRIWGVGFGAKNALKQKERWGLNLLGKALESTREVLREEESKDPQASVIRCVDILYTVDDEGWPAIFHPDPHVVKTIRALVYGAREYGTTPAGGAPGSFIEGKESHPGTAGMDGTIFVRGAGLVMDYMGWVANGQEARGDWDRSALGEDAAWDEEPPLPDTDGRVWDKVKEVKMV